MARRKPVQIRLAPDVAAPLARIAAGRRLSVAAVANEALRRFLAARGLIEGEDDDLFPRRRRDEEDE